MKRICRICGKEIGNKAIGWHIKSQHQMLYIQYVEKFIDQFPNDFNNWYRCRICETIVKGHKTCSMKCSNEYRKTILVGEKAPRYGAKLSKKSKEKISKTHKDKIEKEGHWRIGLKNTINARNNMSKSALKRAQQPDYINPMQGKTHSPEVIKKIFSHKEMNSVEKMVADELAKNSIEYHFQYFLTRGGICKSFDFKIKNKKLFIEVDGDYWHGGPGHKHDYFKGVNEVKENDKFKEQLAMENGFEVIRIWESEVKKNPNLIIERINERV